MASTYEAIASTTLGSAATTVTFSSIAATWTDIIAVINSGTSEGSNDCYIRFNNDSGNNYSGTYLYGNGSSAASARGSNMTGGRYFGGVADATHIFQIMSYSNTNVYKTFLLASQSTFGGASSVFRVAGLWQSTSAINRIDFVQTGGGSNEFKTGTTFSLFGVKAA